MTSLDRIMLARCHRKFAASWMAEGARSTLKAINPFSSNPGLSNVAADVGMSSIPLVGGVYGGLRGISDLAHGNWSSGLLRLGGAAVNIGTLGMGGAAGGAAAGAATRLATKAPTITKGLSGLRTMAAKPIVNTMSNTVSQGVRTAGRVSEGLGTGGMLNQWRKSLTGGGEEAMEEGSALSMEPLLNYTRSNVLQNPMYTQPAQNPLGNFASSFKPQTMFQGMGSASF